MITMKASCGRCGGTAELSAMSMVVIEHALWNWQRHHQCIALTFDERMRRRDLEEARSGTR